MTCSGTETSAVTAKEESPGNEKLTAPQSLSGQKARAITPWPCPRVRPAVQVTSSTRRQDSPADRAH